MNIILIIIIICLSLHTLGFFKKLMQHCTLDTVPPLAAMQPEKAPAPPPNNNTLERRKMEQIAANILLYNGYKKNAFWLVSTLSNERLNEIITDFRNEMEL